ASFATLEIELLEAEKIERAGRALGIAPTASLADVRSAYHRLARSAHPDVADRRAGSAASMAALSDAYKLLARYARAHATGGVASPTTRATPNLTVPRGPCWSRFDARRVAPGSPRRAEEHMSATEPRIYAYGIMWLREADDVAAALPDYGICGRVVRILACGRLAALVTDLPPQALPDDVWRDPDRIKDLILDHHRVLHGAARDRSVLPLRFGAVFS